MNAAAPAMPVTPTSNTLPVAVTTQQASGIEIQDSTLNKLARYYRRKFQFNK